MTRNKKAPAATPTPTKTCTACKQTVPLSSMKNRGHGERARICKACANAKRRVHYWANRNAIRERERRRYHENPEPYRERARNYQRSKRGRALNAEAVKRWRAQRPHKVKAARALRDAIKRGILVRPSM
jgi:hypothetical protein